MPPQVLYKTAALANKHPNIAMLHTRRLVQWGMFSMVAIALDAMVTLPPTAHLSSHLPGNLSASRNPRHASRSTSSQASVVNAGHTFDFFIQLSDADMALRTDAEVRAFLYRSKPRYTLRYTLR